MIRVPKYRPPIHPGEMLQEEFLQSMGLTQRELAAAIHVPYQRVNEIINGKRGVTPSTALRFRCFPPAGALFRSVWAIHKPAINRDAHTAWVMIGNKGIDDEDSRTLRWMQCGG